MNRREMLRVLGSAGVIGTVPGLLWTRPTCQTPVDYRVQGAGPALIAFDRAPKGYFDRFADRYRVIIMDYPPRDDSQAFVDSFTPARVCADVLAVADAAGADRFAWYGFSWGGGVGLQLAARTNRLTALVCGGWPPLGAQYRDMVTVTGRDPGSRIYDTFYRPLQDWPEREAVSKFTCPRMTFAGSKDVIVAYGHTFPHGPTIAAHREELERMGWTVRLVDGFDHELGARPDVVVPLVREFLDPLLLRG